MMCSLRLAHALLALFHFLSALICLLLALRVNIHYQVKVGFFRDIPHLVTFGNSTLYVFDTTSVYFEQVGSTFTPVYISIVFAMLASIDHAYTYYYGEHYDQIIEKNGSVPQRWIEYSLSASFMNVQIALLTGIEEIIILLSVALLTFTMMTFGHLTEQVVEDHFEWNAIEKRRNVIREAAEIQAENRAKYRRNAIKETIEPFELYNLTKPRSTEDVREDNQLVQIEKARYEKKTKEKIANLQFNGWVCYATVWTIIFTAFGKACVSIGFSNLPWFVPAIVLSLFLIESLFGVVQILFLHNIVGREVAYIVLSFIAKTVLNAIVTNGCLTRRN